MLCQCAKNDTNCGYMFWFPMKILTRQGLRMNLKMSTRKWRLFCQTSICWIFACGPKRISNRVGSTSPQYGEHTCQSLQIGQPTLRMIPIEGRWLCNESTQRRRFWIAGLVLYDPTKRRFRINWFPSAIWHYQFKEVLYENLTLV